MLSLGSLVYPTGRFVWGKFRTEKFSHMRFFCPFLFRGFSECNTNYLRFPNMYFLLLAANLSYAPCLVCMEHLQFRSLSFSS